MKYIPVVFFALLGLFFLGVSFPYMQIVLGILALIIAVTYLS